LSLPLEVHPDATEAARRVGALVADQAHAMVEQSGTFSLALSKAPPELLDAIGSAGVLWTATNVYQVDERVAPASHPDRNYTHLTAALPPDALASIRPMPVEDPELEVGAARYEAGLPPSLDLVHLGLGPDGHTASLLPNDPVLDVRDRLVAVTGEYQGRRRMTLTYPALEAAREIVWLVSGAGKRDVLPRLLEGDASIPAGRIANPHQLVVCDQAAAASYKL
jgi:6-phosphogluconolactonase